MTRTAAGETAGGLAAAWNLFKRHWRPFVFAEVSIVAAWVVLEVAVIVVHGSLPRVLGEIAWSLLHLAFLWFFSALMTGMQVMALAAVDGGKPALRTAFDQLGLGARYLAASLVYWIAVLAGLCFVIIPGVVIAVRWALFRPIIASRAGYPLASLKTAASLSKSHRWLLFRVLALSTALELAGAALLGVGLLIAFPVTVLLRAGLFRALERVGVAS